MIDIEVRDSNKVRGTYSAFIKFPYSTELVATMRKQDNRWWHAENKEWEIPAKKLPSFLSEVNGWEIRLVGNNFDDAEQPTASLPTSFKFKTQPFAHQIEGLNYGVEFDKFLLGDEQGLGKTKQVIDIAVAKKMMHGYKHCLIVCGVNSLKWNWQAEVAKHSDEKSWVLGTRFNKGGKPKDPSNAAKLEDLEKLPDAYFLITNVESLRSKEIASRIKYLCDNNIIEMVAIDEIHKCKNPASQQGKGILKMQPKTRIAMTGTPLMNTPLDLFIVLKWLGHEKHNFYMFKGRYCIYGGYGDHEIVGYRNLGELQENLDEIMLRRLKKDALDLPAKIYTMDYVEMGKEQAMVYDEVKATIKEQIDKIKVSPNPLAQLIRLRQASGYTGILSSKIKESAKLDRLEDIVEELVENNKKCVIFSNWTSMTDATMERLKKYNPAIITGDIKDRQFEAKKFMEDDSCKCIIGTLGAMGTGLNLTAASTAIFLDSPWNRANKEQAEDRLHRIGTTETVNIITLVCKDTIDERIEDLIQSKGAVADALVDGEVDFNRGDLVDFLLN